MPREQTSGSAKSAEERGGRGLQRSTVAAGRHIYVDVLTKAWAKVAQDLFGIGDALIQAKAELAHGEFTMMVETELPFGPRAARMLMAVASNPALRNHGSVLPSSWRTLYELSRLPEPTLKAALGDGTINPSMQRKDVARLAGPVPVKAEPEPARLPSGALAVLGPPCDGMDFARMAIMDLEQIRPDDAERAQAFAALRRWLSETDPDATSMASDDEAISVAPQSRAWGAIKAALVGYQDDFSGGKKGKPCPAERKRFAIEVEGALRQFRRGTLS